MESIVIPLSLFGMIFGIVMVSVWGSVQSKRELNETVRRAIDKGQQLDAETIGSLHKPVRTPNQDLRGGIVLMFLALGFAVGGCMASGWLPGMTGWDEEAGVGFFVAAAIVGFIGLGQFVAAMMRREKKDT